MYFNVIIIISVLSLNSSLEYCLSLYECQVLKITWQSPRAWARKGIPWQSPKIRSQIFSSLSHPSITQRPNPKGKIQYIYDLLLRSNLNMKGTNPWKGMCQKTTEGRSNTRVGHSGLISVRTIKKKNSLLVSCWWRVIYNCIFIIYGLQLSAIYVKTIK